MSDITVAAVIGGLLGAKIYYVLLTGDSIFHRGGFVFGAGSSVASRAPSR